MTTHNLTTMQRAYAKALIKKLAKTKQREIEEIREEMKRNHPRYDKIYFEGLRWMDEH